MLTQEPLFVEPDAPDLKPILELHRGHDGFVSFHRKDAVGNLQDLFSIRAAELDGIFPQLSPMLETDSYFSINGMFRGGYGVARNSPDGQQLPRAHRDNKSLRWLTCCFADMDCHTLGITVGAAVGALIDAQDRGDIPPASMLTRSGRGVWAFWFLTGSSGEGLQRAYSEKVRTWCAIQRTIGQKLAYLGSDAGARDASRITRIAGSVNSKAQSKVSYWVQHRAGGKRFTYTMAELAESLGVTVGKNHPAIDETVRAMTTQGKLGARARWKNDIDRFTRLQELRGQWEPGLRNNAIFILTTILRSAKSCELINESAVEFQVRQAFNLCVQPPGDLFTWSQVKAIMTKGEKRPVYHQTIADMLDVKPEESAVVGWPAASRFGSMPRVELGRKELQEKRRSLLREWIGKLGYVPTAQAAVDYLARMIGIDPSKTTVIKDMKSVGHPVPRSRRRKPPKSARKNDRKLF